MTIIGMIERVKIYNEVEESRPCYNDFVRLLLEFDYDDALYVVDSYEDLEDFLGFISDDEFISMILRYDDYQFGQWVNFTIDGSEMKVRFKLD